MHLPDYDYNKDQNRVWLFNEVNSFIFEDFAAFVDEKIEVREQSLANSKTYYVLM